MASRHLLRRSNYLFQCQSKASLRTLHTNDRGHRSFLGSSNDNWKTEQLVDMSPSRKSSTITTISTRTFARKAGKMGQHLKKLDELAHREEHMKAKERRKNKKKGKKGEDKDNAKDVPASASSWNEEPEWEEMEIDESETIFDHGVDEGSVDESSDLPSAEDVKGRMMKVVSAMEKSFRSIRGAEPSVDLFDNLQVEAYGALTPLNAVAQVVISSPTQATLTCFDPLTAPAVRDAVRSMAGMNFNPRIEDGAVIVPIPRISAETRKAIVKQLGKVAESTKQRIRRIRRAAQDVVKKGKDGKLGPGISEDDAFRTGKEIDVVTEECNKALTQVVEQKQADVMKV